MTERKPDKKKPAWVVLSFGMLVVLFGGIMTFQGVTAYKTGAIIPPTTKSGPMTGLQSIFAGIIATIAGLSCVGYEIIKTIKTPNFVYTIGKHQVIVKRKNMSWGILKSLDLYLANGQCLNFYCTAEKVAGMLLNDFVINEKAVLEIKTSDGQQCELKSKNAYAYGNVSFKNCTTISEKDPIDPAA